jgi:hypothetical protein
LGDAALREGAAFLSLSSCFRASSFICL